MRYGALLLTVLAAGWISGCDNLSDNLSPQGTVRAWHATPDLWQVIVQVRNSATGTPNQNLGTLEYGGVSVVLNLGQDSYPVTVRVREPGAVENPIALEFTQLVSGERVYELVVTGSAANPELLTWERASNSPSGRVSYGNAAPSIGAVDVYVEAPGADLLAATPRATLAFRDFAPNTSLPAGEYQLTVTSQGDPLDVLFASAAFDLGGGSTPTFALLDSADLAPSPVLVRVVGLAGVSFLEDVSTPPLLRAGHSAIDAGNVDVAVDNQFTPPLIGNLAFQAVSGYATTTADEVALTVTEAGNPGVLLVEDTIDLGSGSFNSLFVVGSVANDDLAVTRTVDSRRSIAEFAQFRFVQGASNFAFADVYLVPTGESFTRFAPVLAGVPFGAITNYSVISPDTYDLVIARNGTATELARIDAVVLDELNLYSVLITDNVDPDIVDLVLFDDFIP